MWDVMFTVLGADSFDNGMKILPTIGNVKSFLSNTVAIDEYEIFLGYSQAFNKLY